MSLDCLAPGLPADSVQYFLWYMVFLPIYLPDSIFLRRPYVGLCALFLWIAGQVRGICETYSSIVTDIARLSGFSKGFSWNFLEQALLQMVFGFQALASLLSIPGFWVQYLMMFARISFNAFPRQAKINLRKSLSLSIDEFLPQALLYGLPLEKSFSRNEYWEVAIV